ncbi:MAG: MMPL family transporter [Candidatus Binatia bacterium]
MAGEAGPERLTRFERYARSVVAHRVMIVCAVLAITVGLGSQLGSLHLEIRRRANLPESHPYVQIQNRISDIFGGEAIVILGVIARDGDVFTPAMLAKIQRITGRLRESPNVIEPSLYSLAAPYVRTVLAGPDGAMQVEPLMGPGAPDAATAARVRERVMADPLFRETLVSADRRAAMIVADFDDRIKDVELATVVEQAVAPERDDTVTVALAGAPILRRELARYTAMIAFLFPLAVVIIGLVHYEAFRTVQAMLLPLVTALLSVIWSLGIMALIGLPMDTWSVMTPVLILAIAAGHAVQILKRYYEEYGRCGDSDEAVVRSLVAVGPVMLTAGLIAAAGFGSLATFGITSVRAFGGLLAAGIVSALIIEMTFTPACRCLLPAPKRREVARESGTRLFDQVIDALGRAAIDRPRLVIAGAVLAAAVLGVGIARLRVDNSFRLWFAPSTQVRIDDALLNQALPGTATLRILVEGAREGAILEPAVLRAMVDLQDEMRRVPELGGVTSIADQVRRMNQAMHDGDPAFYSIPDDPKVVGEYVFLYASSVGPDGLDAFVDHGNRNAVIRALSKTDSAAFSRELLQRLEAFAAQRFADLPVHVGVAGGTLGVQTAMNDLVVHEKIVNMLQVGAIIFLLCAAVLRSLVGAALVVMPLALAVVSILGAMGWLGVWLDMSTAAITAMGVSIGADFAIYLLFRMREELRAGGALEDALRTGLQTSGKAALYVSSAVVAGYLTLALSGFSVWIRLAVLTSAMVALSALAACLVLPAILQLLRPAFLSRTTPSGARLASPVVGSPAVDPAST